MTEPRPDPEPERDDGPPPYEPAPHNDHTDSPLVDLRLFEDLI